MFLFPRAAITSYCKLCGQQQNVFSPSSGGHEPESVSRGWNQGVSGTWLLPQVLGENLLPSPSASGGCQHPSAMACSLHLHLCGHCTFSSSVSNLPLPFSYKGTVYMIAFRVHQDNEDKLFTSKSLITYAKSFFTTASNFQIQGLGRKSLGVPTIRTVIFEGFQVLWLNSFGGPRD